MKSLEDEALEYSGIDPDELIDLGDDRVRVAGHFIAGANSKWVQAEKIKAQIGVLKELSAEGVSVQNLQLIILRLGIELKQLEDEQTDGHS
jgi:hypothetical protein